MTIRTPVAFQRVVLVIAIGAMVNQDTVTVMKAFATSVEQDPERYMYVGVHENRGMGWLAYDWAVGFLEPTLGGAVWLEDDGSTHLEFFPQRSALLASSKNKDAKVEEEV